MEDSRRLRLQTVGNVFRNWEVNFKPNWDFPSVKSLKLFWDVKFFFQSGAPRCGELIAEHKGVDSLLWP